MHHTGRLRKAEVTVAGQGVDKANTHLYEYDDRGLLTKDVLQLGWSGASVQNVSWTNAVGVNVAGNTITKNNSVGWSSGAVSTQSIPSGSNGYVEATVAQYGQRMMVGLSNGDSGTYYEDIDFALYTYPDGTLMVFEAGVHQGTFGTYAVGDVLRVAVEGGTIKYYKNGGLIYTSGTAPSYPLLVDSALYDSGVSVSNARISTGSGGSRTLQLSYSYDKGGRLLTTTYPNPGTAEVLSTGYNTQGMGLPNSLSSNVESVIPVQSVTYNERGQMLTLGQGNTTNLNYLTTSYSYDDTTTKRGWLTKTKVTSNGGANNLLELNLGYDAVGNITSVGQTAGGTGNIGFTNTFQYDGLERLRTASSTDIGHFPNETHSFDMLGRMTTRQIGATPYSYSYGNSAHKDAPTAYKGNTYSYDAVGNQVGGPGQSRLFDPENRLVRIVNGSTTSDFVYDANGMRVLTKETTGSTIERTAYFAGMYEEQLTGSASPPYINYYKLGGQTVGLRRANQSTMNGQYRMVSDHLGSASMMVDTSSGSSGPVVKQRQYFRAYGEVAYSWTAAGSLTDIGYTGQRVEGNTGLMYYGARFYDPQLSYFASADTIGVSKGSAQSRNRYGYVLNNPLRFIDPTGHCSDNPSRTDGKTCDGAEQSLKRYGFRIARMLDWDLDELLIMLNAIRQMMHKLGWTRDTQFRIAMGIDALGEIYLERLYARKDDLEGGGRYYDPGEDATNPAAERTYENVNKRVITITFLIFSKMASADLGVFEQNLSRLFVHEVAHAWDAASGDYNNGVTWASKDLADSTGGHWVGDTYMPGGHAASEYAVTGAFGHGSPAEDWAESVAAYVYPDHPRYNNYNGGDYHDSSPAYGMDAARYAAVARQAAWVQRMGAAE